MTGVEIILAALATGAVAGVTEVATTAVSDAYGKLKGALSRLFAGDTKAEITIDLFESDPEGLTQSVAKALDAHGADADEDVLEAAREVLRVAGPAATGPGSVAAAVLNVHAETGGVAAVNVTGDINAGYHPAPGADGEGSSGDPR